MRSRQINFISMCRRVSGLIEKQIAIFNEIPVLSKLLSDFKGNLNRMQGLATDQQKIITGMRLKKAEMKLDLARETMNMSHRTEAYAVITNDVILQQKVHLAETHLLKLSDVNFISACSIVYHTAQANREVLIGYGADEASLTHLRTAIDNYQAVMDTPKEAIIIRKQLTHQLAERIVEQRAILDKLDGLVGSMQYTQPAMYAVYKDTRVVLYRSRSLAAMCRVMDAASTKAVAGATLTFYRNEVMILKKSSAKGGGSRIKSLPNGTYTLTVSRLGYTSQTLAVQVSNTKLTTINVALEKAL